MHVTTFYSYKGGVGRTLACANFGLYLAKTGRKVVLADMDLEAPGLDSKFPTVDVAGFHGGMLDQFSAFQSGHEIPEFHAMDIPLPDDVARSGGRLQLIPAGDYLSPDYYPKLSRLQWDVFLQDESGLAFCIDTVKRIEEACGADVLVIDSRTGLTEVGGLCTQVLPDTVVLFTCTSPESLSGTKRVYNRIHNSPIVKKRLRGRTEVGLRIVIARTPRPDDLPAFDEAMKKRLGIEVERLYYLFEQRDLSLEEYLALDRLAEEHPAILDDYVELFASFDPEITMPYIEKRLDSFRSELTRRSPDENERLIQELLTLFPQPEVLLEAGRYYRIAKEGETKSLANYLRYLENHPNDAQVLSEFAQVCESVPEAELKPQEEVAKHLKAFGTERMNAKLLGRYFRLFRDEEEWREIVNAIESDDAKLESRDFRRTYFRALHALGESQKIVETASESETRSRPIGLLIAEAHASLENVSEVFDFLNAYEIDDPKELVPLLRLLYKVSPSMDVETIRDLLTRRGRLRPPWLHDLRYFLHIVEAEAERRVEDPGFQHWLEKLEREIRRGE